MFIDGTAAIFGVLSASIAIAITFFAAWGWSSYRKLLVRVEADVTQRLEKDFAGKIILPMHKKVEKAVDLAIFEKLKSAIEEAEFTLNEEIRRLSKAPEWVDQFTNEIEARVLERLRPSAQDITTSEFD